MVETQDQLELFDIVPASSGLTIEEAFEEFHRNNPHVYRNLRYLALKAVRAGRRKIGMKLLFERLRWEYFLDTKREEGDFALNNNFTSRYARLLMQNEPELAGRFETRELRPERKRARVAAH